MGKTTITAPPGQPFIDIEREFDARRELVHRAYLDPALVSQWLGPRAYTTTIDRWDAREGGTYRYIHTNADGSHAFHGVFHSMAIDNMVQTFEYEGAPGHVSLDTQAFIDLGGGRTRLQSHSVFMSVADRDEMIRNGMEAGVESSYDRLEELLGKLQPVGAAT